MLEVLAKSNTEGFGFGFVGEVLSSEVQAGQWVEAFWVKYGEGRFADVCCHAVGVEAADIGLDVFLGCGYEFGYCLSCDYFFAVIRKSFSRM